MLKLATMVFIFSTLTAGSSFADEQAFLSSISGAWSGKGTVVRKIGSAPLNVTCQLKSQVQGTSLSMAGSCRGFVVVSRAISADISANGPRYSGTYIGPSGRPSKLSGSRAGNSIRFAVTWSRDVNGDRSAQMTIEKTGAAGLRLRTIDKDLKTGRMVTTSDLILSR